MMPPKENNGIILEIIYPHVLRLAYSYINNAYKQQHYIIYLCDFITPITVEHFTI